MRRCASLMQWRITPDVRNARRSPTTRCLRRFGAEFRPVVLTDSTELYATAGAAHATGPLSLRGRGMIDEREA